MSLSEYIESKKQLYQKVIEFLEGESNTEDDLSKFIETLNDFNLDTDKDELLSFLHLISSIVNNHYRTPELISKTEHILLHYKDQIKRNFTNFKIFKIFKDNMKLLYILFKSSIIIPDESIYQYLLQYKSKKYLIFFSIEFAAFFDDELRASIEEQTKEFIENGTFEENRKLGENESKICHFIRNDMVKDFIIFVNQTNLSLSSEIKCSIFETNPYLLGTTFSLIEYSAFFGSIQIFRYLIQNNVQFDKSICYFSIHGKNPDIIRILEENKIFENKNLFIEYLIESIKCHHNDIAKYIQNVLIDDIDKEDKYDIESYKRNVVKHYNFLFFCDDLNNSLIFNSLSEYDHIGIVKLLLNSLNFDINDKNNVFEINFSNEVLFCHEFIKILCIWLLSKEILIWLKFYYQIRKLILI